MKKIDISKFIAYEILHQKGLYNFFNRINHFKDIQSGTFS